MCGLVGMASGLSTRSQQHATQQPRRQLLLPSAARPRARQRRAVAPAAAAAGPSSRRACDVVVLGSSLQAYATAYLLAKQGRRTVVVEHCAPLTQRQLAGAPPLDVPLHLPATDPHLVNEAGEALSLWRGVETAAGGAKLLALCGSADIGPMRGSSDAAEVLAQMRDASKAAGLTFGMLSGEEIGALFPTMRLPRGAAALYTTSGGVLHGAAALSMLRALAKRAGADLLPAPGRTLLGWRDGGSHFAVRTAPAGPEGMSGAAARRAEAGCTYECERLALLPDAGQQTQLLRLFGLEVGGLELQRWAGGLWRAQEDCAALPLWQLLGLGSAGAPVEGGTDTALERCWGTPVLGWATGSVAVWQSPADRSRVEAAASSSGSSRGGGSSEEEEEQGAAEQRIAEQGDGERGEREAAAGAAAAAAAEGREQQSRARGALAAQLARGVGGLVGGSLSTQLHAVTPDGEPAVGPHPGFEAGRVTVALAAGGGDLGGALDARQLAPLLAQLAAAEVAGGGSGMGYGGVDTRRVALGREVLDAAAVPLKQDTWGELPVMLT